MHVHPYPGPFPRGHVGDVIHARPLIFEANLLVQVIQEYGTHVEVEAVLAMLRSKAAELLSRPRPTLDDIDNALGHAAE
jgi:hypothetical protein